ncbi:hypothetical protein JCM10908_003992 [Rhodotorula pacifica]|uniref:translation initiation factor 3 subunit CLU1 n=1 Tax=Rhodotorula pacifica TaxID=1495444 RepID=UPI00317B543F
MVQPVDAEVAPEQVNGVEQNGDLAVDEAAAAAAAVAVEVTLLIPTQSFIALTGSPAKSASANDFIELPLPIALTDAVHDLRAIITDAPEGFWLGAFSLAPYYADEIAANGTPEEGQEKRYGEWKKLTPPPRKAIVPGEVDTESWSLNEHGVLGDFSDLTAVFGGDAAQWEGKKRALKVTLTPFSAASMHMHLLKVRDVLFSTLPPFASTTSSYDPTTFAIGAGTSLYASISGSAEASASTSDAPPSAAEETTEEKAPLANGKGKKGKATKKPVETVEETPASTSPPQNGPHAFTDFKVESLSASDFVSQLANATASPSYSCLRALGVSPWSPPPHPRRMRGELIYITVQTLESEQFTITGAINGFWISKTTNATFDPSPRAVLPKGVRAGPYHSLFELLADISPSFRKNLAPLIARSSRTDLTQSELVASMAITHTQPPAPYLVKPPTHVADPFRTQAAYLITSSTTAEQLPAARDWNDEFGQFYDLPRSTVNDRLLRERLICRTQADFVAAATRGAMSIARGDVAPLNPNEPAAAHTYIHNNLLYTKAEDAAGMYSHLGGDEASRYAAGKDLRGIEILERLDVDGLSVMQTVLVDYLGQRWIAQSLIPGLFKTARDGESEVALASDGAGTVYPVGDEQAKQAAQAAKENDKAFPSEETPNKDDYPPTASFRIIYGAASPEKPDEKVRAAAYFHEKLAKPVAKLMRFAEHTVKASDGKVTKLYTSSDMHGIAAPDGRSYFIDCFRMQCVDVEFKEKNSAKEDGIEEAYPHRLVLLRPELLEAYRESKLEAWLKEQVKATQEKVAKEQQSIEAELKEAASTDAAEQPQGDAEKPADAAAAKPTVPTTSVINAEDFILNYNPDAFVDRKELESGKDLVIYDPEDESTKNVRLASQYLRDVVLREFITEAAAAPFLATDGFLITRTLHRKGINMRYLGLLAAKIDTEGDKLELGKATSKEEAAYALQLLRQNLLHEMVIRAAKHIINRHLRTAGQYDAAGIVSHLYNCLLGSTFNASPVAETVELPSDTAREWDSVTPASLRAELRREIAARFRYNLPESWFEEDMLKSKVLRELSLRVGVQLTARRYDFGTAGAADASTLTPVPAPASPQPESESSTTKKAKKGKKGKAAASEPVKPQGEPTTFNSVDVLNVAPVIKSTQHRSALVEDMFFQGQRAIHDGQAEVGEALVNDALHLCEQIFGAVHPEAADKYHALGIMWHNIAQRIMRTLRTHDTAEQALRDLPAQDREQYEKQVSELLMPDAEGARAEVEAYLQQAVRLVRQSIVISERTHGIDSADANTQYSDLGLLEQQAGNLTVGLQLTRHAMNLHVSTYGPKHPQLYTLLSNAATMVQSRDGVAAALPLHLENRKLAELIYGADSVAVGQAEHILGQTYVMLQDIGAAHTHIQLARDLLLKHLGEEAQEVKEATQFIRLVEATVARDAQEQQAREERLQARVAQSAAGHSGANSRANGVSRAASGRRAAPNGTAAPVAPSPAPPRPHGEKADLSVDALVDYIQGSGSSSSSRKARKNKA